MKKIIAGNGKFFGSLVACSLVVCANAQENYELSNVVVSATGFEQDADSNIRHVMVIEGDELTKRGYSSIEQALERVPGISFVNSGLGRNIDMRGQGDKANVAVKVLVDGRAINVLDNSHGITPLDAINLDNVERIEIIPGGGAVLYGNGTRGGVINIITKKRKQDGAILSVKGTAFDDGNFGGSANANLSKKFTDNFALSANVNGFNRDGYQDGTEEKGFFVNTKAYIDFSEKSSLIFGYDFFETEKANTGYLTKEQIDSDPTQRGSDDILQKITRPELSLDFTHRFNDQWEFNANGFWQNQEIEYLRDIQLTTTRGTTLPVNQGGSSFEDTLKGIELKAKYNYTNGSYLVFGYDFEQHNAKRKNLMSYSISPVITHRMTTLMDMEKQSHSLFALDSHQLTDKFSISGGARYEYAEYEGNRYYLFNTGFGNPTPTTFQIETQDTSNFAFEITPNYQYSDSGSVYLKYERGYISPSPAQFVSRDNRTGNPPYFLSDLDSETYNTFEIGVKDFWSFFGFNLTAFYTQSEDEIAYAGDPHSATGAFWSYYNIDETKRIGVELELSQTFLEDKLVFRESLTYIDAEISKGINDGLRVPYVSKVKATGSVEYSWTNNFQTFLDISYNSRAKDGGVVTRGTSVIDPTAGQITNMDWMKESFVVDIGATYAYKDFTILAGVRNLFDDEYTTYQGYNIYESVSSGTKKYSPAAGRNYYVELKYAF